MNVEFINPFLESLLNVLRTMATMEAKPGAPEVKKNDIANGDVTGLIGMASEQAKGTLAITFTEPVIVEITRRMLGEEVTGIDDTVTDMVGEITNMVMGSLKSRLQNSTNNIAVSIPTVVTGLKLQSSLGEGTNKTLVKVRLENEYIAELSILYKEASQ